MSLKKLLFVTFSFAIIHFAAAQQNFDHNNHIGIQGGLTLFNVDTDNFVTEQGLGYIMGFTTRGAFYNDFDLIYGINFIQTEVGLAGRDLNETQQGFFKQSIDYTIQSAQISLLLSYNIVYPHLSIEVGPMLNVNGKMKLKQDTFNEFILDGYTDLKAEDVQNISRVHFYTMGGLTMGFENFRLSAQYQYGVTNLYGRLNDSEDIDLPDTKFEGNPHTIVGMVILYL